MSNKNNERAEVRIMAEIKLVRVDYRLIHGQVVARWLKVCPVRRIVLVDDVLGNDEFMSDIYKMAVPKGKDVDIVTIDKPKEVLDNTDDTVFLISKDIETCLKLVEKGVELPAINVGAVPNEEGRKLITTGVAISQKELDMLEELNSKGTGSTFNAISRKVLEETLVPDVDFDKQHEYAKILEKIYSVIQNRKKELVRFDDFIKARFVEMFGDPLINEKGWKIRKLKNISNKIGSGATPKGGKEVYIHNGISLIRSMNVYNNRFEYKELALVITDEQHRFGVNQRRDFSQKGKSPHILVMSATPIPRTLAIILYGDLDISIIDEMPANRLPIKNCVVDESYRPKAYAFIHNQVASGRQCYVICPMVEDSEAVEAENVVDYTAMLKKELPDIRIEYLHGKMRPSLKNEVMERFAAHETDVLVSTTVIEVGVNVPNSTVMMVENSERFGLAQLHQLRGRVGRGEYQSYCIFVTGNKSEKIRKRLEILNKSNDGFKIAEEDLRLRGPGDFFGVRQSGDFDFGIADVFTDAKTLKEASDAAKDMLKKDPELKLENNVYLKQKVAEYTIKCLEKINL